MLILEGVRQFVSDHGFLPFKVDPVGKVKLPLLRIVIARHLFSKQVDDERTIPEIGRHESEFFKRQLARAHFGGRRFFIEVAHDHALDLRAGLRAAFHRT